MVKYCCVPGCTSTEKMVKLHRFPISCSKQTSIWLKRIGSKKLYSMEPKKLSDGYRICSLHFHKINLIADLRRGLKAGSLPTLNLQDYAEEPTEDNCFFKNEDDTDEIHTSQPCDKDPLDPRNNNGIHNEEK